MSGRYLRIVTIRGTQQACGCSPQEDRCFQSQQAPITGALDPGGVRTTAPGISVWANRMEVVAGSQGETFAPARLSKSLVLIPETVLCPSAPTMGALGLRCGYRRLPPQQAGSGLGWDPGLFGCHRYGPALYFQLFAAKALSVCGPGSSVGPLRSAFCFTPCPFAFFGEGRQPSGLFGELRS